MLTTVSLNIASNCIKKDQKNIPLNQVIIDKKLLPFNLSKEYYEKMLT
jgi:hypothetical protein